MELTRRKLIAILGGCGAAGGGAIYMERNQNNSEDDTTDEEDNTDDEETNGQSDNQDEEEQQLQLDPTNTTWEDSFSAGFKRTENVERDGSVQKINVDGSVETNLGDQPFIYLVETGINTALDQDNDDRTWRARIRIDRGDARVWRKNTDGWQSADLEPMNAIPVSIPLIDRHADEFTWNPEDMIFTAEFDSLPISDFFPQSHIMDEFASQETWTDIKAEVEVNEDNVITGGKLSATAEDRSGNQLQDFETTHFFGFAENSQYEPTSDEEDTSDSSS